MSRIAWLGYADLGMTGWPQNAAPDALMNADVDQAPRALVAVLDAEGADIVTGYDWHGGYGHPDHVLVHRIVRRAVELAACRPRLLEVTMNRDAMRAMFRAAKAGGMDTADWDPDGPVARPRPGHGGGLDLRPEPGRQVVIRRWTIAASATSRSARRAAGPPRHPRP
jgi:LmbE family N-acetylglucosaminyl deacetylase